MQYCVRGQAVLKQHMPPTAHAVTASTAVACHSAVEDTDILSLALSPPVNPK